MKSFVRTLCGQCFENKFCKNIRTEISLQKAELTCILTKYSKNDRKTATNLQLFRRPPKINVRNSSVSKISKCRFTKKSHFFNFHRELQQRIPNELLSELATCVIEGPVFEIVQGLKDVQNAEEKQLFKERLGVLRSHSSNF